ncbi:MAG: CoA ester lyase [Myxococcota bacterium]
MRVASRPRRSVLYMPGSNARSLTKGRSLDADALIMDLEDSVAPDQKEQARAQVVEAVKQGGYGHRELIIRVNGRDTPWGVADLKVAAASGADVVLLPKVESADEVRKSASILSDAGASDTLRLWCMIETPRGVLQAAQIAEATPRIGGFVLGTSDLAKDLGCAHTHARTPLLPSLGLVLLAARSVGIAALDGVHLDLEDEAGFVFSCEQGAELGFDGKTLIHPKQIGPANKAFAPADEAIALAQKVIDAHREALRQGKGVVTVDGKLIENLHVESARSLLAMADAIRSRH